MVGQTIMAIAFPFTFNAPALLSANWFGEKERIYATSTGANAAILGVGLGYLIPIIFVSDNDRGSTAEAHIFNLMLCLAIMSTLILIPFIFTFQAKPLTPPSVSLEKTAIKQGSSSIKKEIVDILKNLSFMMITSAFSLIFGYLFSFTTVIYQLITIYGFTSE